MDSRRKFIEEDQCLVSALRELFRALCVSQNALLEIAGKTADEGIARMLYDLALARGKLALELRPFVEAQVGSPDGGHLLSELNAIGRRIYSALVANDTFVVLSDLEELEALLLRSVRRVVAATQGHQVQKVLQRQFDHVKRSYASVQDLRDPNKWHDGTPQRGRISVSKRVSDLRKKNLPYKGEDHELGSN